MIENKHHQENSKSFHHEHLESGHKNILAAFFFFCLTLLGVKLAFWQYERFLWKESVLTAYFSGDNTLEHPYQKALVSIQRLGKDLPVVLVNPDPRTEQVYCPIEGSIASLKIEGILKVPVSRKVSNQIESYSSYCEQNFDFPFEAEVIRLPIIKRPFIIKRNEQDKDAIRVNQLSDQDSYSYLLSLDIDLFSQDLLLSQRHWGYMLQWSFLSLLSLGFSFYFLLRKKNK